MRTARRRRDLSISLRRYLLVAFGGGAGSLVRYLVTVAFAGKGGWAPLPILLINISGCFFIAFLHFFSDPTGAVYLRPGARLFLMIGFCGGYTTFSSFSLLVFRSFQQKAWYDAALNIMLSHFLCLTAIWAGYVASNLLTRPRRKRNIGS